MRALITGASVGIGRALAFEYAQNGYDLILVSRNGQDLEKVAQQCREQHGVDAIVFPLDLTRTDSAQKLASFLERQGLRVDSLVNNAGFGVHGSFIDTDLSLEESMVTLQITSLVQLTKLVLPKMVARGSGSIMNVASVYAYSPVPFQAVYAACKAFMRSFSEALSSELQGTGVSVTLVCPGVTRTEFRQRAGIKPKKPNAGMSAEEVAAIAFQGMSEKKDLVVPGKANRVFVLVARHLHGAAMSNVMRLINRIRGVNPGSHAHASKPSQKPAPEAAAVDRIWRKADERQPEMHH